MTSEDNMGTKESESGNLLQVDLLSKPLFLSKFSAIGDFNDYRTFEEPVDVLSFRASVNVTIAAITSTLPTNNRTVPIS